MSAKIVDSTDGVQPTVSYRVCECFEVFVGACYMSLDTGLRFPGPLGIQRILAEFPPASSRRATQ